MGGYLILKLLAYIPARSGSKAVPNKNIMPIKNVPLLSYSLYCAMDCLEQGLFSDVLLSTDSVSYLKIAEQLGYYEKYLRPREFALDSSPTIDGIIHALDYLKTKDKRYDAVMILQPTAPFRTSDHVKTAIDLLENHPEATCVTGLKKLGDVHPARIKKLVDALWLHPYCKNVVEKEPSRRQDFNPEAYIRNGTIYLTPIHIIKRGLIRGERPIGFVMPEENSINVDDHMDFVIAKSTLDYQTYRKNLRYFNALFSLYND